jgi:dTDP-4-dehydrorhamnose 3,5-epimerase
MTVRRTSKIQADGLPRPKLQLLPTAIDGCLELRPGVMHDARGFFTKVFHRPLWTELGLCTHFAEEYVTHSVHGTVRGMHFQVPPMQHHKVVLCLHGTVLDVVLDLRANSATYGEHVCTTLSAEAANAMYLAPGLAHGFCVTSKEAMLYYKVSSAYSPVHDCGIRWDSAGVRWPVADPLISERDKNLIPLSEFASPFTIPERDA